MYFFILIGKEKYSMAGREDEVQGSPFNLHHGVLKASKPFYGYVHLNSRNEKRVRTIPPTNISHSVVVILEILRTVHPHMKEHKFCLNVLN